MASFCIPSFDMRRIRIFEMAIAMIRSRMPKRFGYAFGSGEDVRVFLEGGALLAFAQFNDTGGSVPSSSTTILGGYGVVAVRYALR